MMLRNFLFFPGVFLIFFMWRETAYAIFIILLTMSSSFVLILSVSWNLCDSSLRDILRSFLISCSNVDSLLFRSAVQLHPWNFFSLDSWVSATVFLCISYFLGFSPLFCILSDLSSYYKSPYTSENVFILLSSLVWWLAYIDFYWKKVSLRALRIFLHHLLPSRAAHLFVGFLRRLWNLLDFSLYFNVSDAAEGTRYA